MNACAAAGIKPVIAVDREAHHPSLEQRFAEPPPPPRGRHAAGSNGPPPQVPEGKKRHALREQTPEPVFGIIKSVLGRLWNLIRMFVLASTN